MNPSLLCREEEVTYGSLALSVGVLSLDGEGALVLLGHVLENDGVPVGRTVLTELEPARGGNGFAIAKPGEGSRRKREY